MRLFKIHLNPRCKEARRDLGDPYQMHATLCRAFFPSDTPCPAGALLWRLEPETNRAGEPRVLIQARSVPDWSRIPATSWLAQAEPGIDLVPKLRLDALQPGQTFRFRLRANPSRVMLGKRQGLMRTEEKLEWIARKAKQHGFALSASSRSVDFNDMLSPGTSAFSDIRISGEELLKGRKSGGSVISVYSSLFDGILVVTNADQFRIALETGIGHGKVLGLGLLSIAPLAR